MNDTNWPAWIFLAIAVPAGLVAVASMEPVVEPRRLATVRMEVTAYCPCPKCCGRYADGITASGHHIRRGDRFVASDRRYRYGTMLRIPGYNRGRAVPVLDRGGVIRDNRIDVFFDSHEAALQWGRQYLEVDVMEVPK